MIDASQLPSGDGRALTGQQDARVARRVMIIAFGALGILALVKFGLAGRVQP